MPKTDEELKEIALGIYNKQIFTDRHCNRPEDVSLVFMGIVFMEKQQLNDLIKKDPGLFYEYIDKALPRSINGYPCFTSFNVISRAEAKKVDEYYKKISEAVENV